MMKKLLIILLLVPLLLAACRAPAAEHESAAVSAEVKVIDVYRSPTCACCEDWIAYLENNGYTVRVHDVENPTAVKNQYRVPGSLYSCHTAIMDGYVIEGHVPIEEIEQLLTERPNIAGIAVAGMPIGSPGMEVDGLEAQPYDVVAFDNQGNMEQFMILE
jgi:hypothetical protein